MADVAAGGNAAIQLKGASELARGLKRAGDDLKDLKDVNRQAAGIVSAAGRSDAPKRSGRLARSIRAGATQKAGVVRAGSKSVPYAGVIHYGWPKRHIKAQPWLAAAAKRTEPEWTGLYEQAVQKIIDRIYTA